MALKHKESEDELYKSNSKQNTGIFVPYFSGDLSSSNLGMVTFKLN